MKTIFRKGNKIKWVTLDKEFLNNPELSFKAKGVLAYLLSLPDNWEAHPKEITQHGKEGEIAVRSAFKELIKNCYLKFKQERDNVGKFIRKTYFIYETPYSGNFDIENFGIKTPHSDNPRSDNHQLLNTDILNTDKDNKSSKINFNFKTEEWENISADDLAEWQSMFPNCDVLVELKCMKNWLMDNPKNAKKLYRRFIMGWLRRARSEVVEEYNMKKLPQGKEEYGNDDR